jgi:hypothetical protein
MGDVTPKTGHNSYNIKVGKPNKRTYIKPSNMQYGLNTETSDN